MSDYAFFDFDNTLSKGDSILSFLPFCVRKGYVSPFHLLRTAAAWIKKTVTGEKDFIPVKETTFAFLNGKSRQEIDKICIEFVDEVLSERLYPQGKAEMEKRRTEGKQTVIVSASSELYMRHIGRLLPVDRVISTTCEFRNGIYTGKMHANCKGGNKVSRIMEELGYNAANDRCVCYGDSSGDLPMLELGYERYLVNCRKKKIISALPSAEIKNWKVSGSK